MRSTAPAASFFDPIFPMHVFCFDIFPFPGFGVPVPHGRSAALGQVSSKGAVWGRHHLLADTRL
eukprot:scaffold2077_cov333-Pavlova_lutheri.AAC.1